MKKLLTILGFLVIFASLGAGSIEAYTTVKGYYKSNGTYVNSYVRSNSNGIKYDNYSYKSYKPSYNKSYYSTGRSSSWYTPSYKTDSNYYAGKSIYNSYRY